MVKTNSTMVALGTKAPDFHLRDTISNQEIKLSQFSKNYKAVVIMFICNHCPFVKHLNPGLVKIAADYQHQAIGFIAINSNDVENFPEDSPENMRLQAQQLGYTFPYLYDETQEVAQLYQAACTPDFFVYDNDQALVYRGQFDDSRPGNTIPVTGNDLRQALDCILANQPNLSPQKPSIGCNIKWKSKK